MARSRIVLSLSAERDLDALFDWIARDSGVERAEAVLRRIEETLELVAAMPRIGRVRHDLDGEPRTFAVWPWVVVYEPLSPRDGIIVWRVIDGRTDLPGHIRR
ncbi:MAG TPA: type II toxin-antitoxin system RelE/ParE family toxin [Caulobacteraceae bacterium]|nr:type II toxin-antitoxin system RelE/ParE family toxin [Caulobacteraceae bacterium]